MRQVESISLTLNLACSNCHQAIHVPGLLGRVVCPHCATHAKVDWDKFGSIVREGLLKRPGRSQSYQFFGGGEGSIDAAHTLPRCSECKVGIPLTGIEDADELTCAKGHPISIRKANALAGRLVPGALWIVGEGVNVDAAEQREQAPILLNCNACAGDLHLDGDTDRNLTCTYCSSLNVIPDALWIRLHPELRPRGFGIVASWGPDEQQGFELSCRMVDVKRQGKRKPLVEGEAKVTAQWPVPPGDGLAWACTGMDANELARLAKIVDIPARLVAILAAERATLARMAVAGRPDLPVDLQVQLAADAKRSVRSALLEREVLAPAAALILAKSDDDRTLDHLAKRKELSPAIRISLARTGRAGPLEAMTAADVDSADLAMLAAAEDLDLARRLVAEHPLTTAFLLDALASDPQLAIREAVAKHPALPRAAMQKLLDGEDPQIARTIAWRDDVPDTLLTRLAKLGGELQKRVLQRENCPPILLDEASGSDQAEVQELAALHVETSEEAIVKLVHRATAPAVIAALLARVPFPALDRALATATSPDLRLAAVRRGPAPEQLEVLATDKYKRVRRAVAQLSDLPGGLAVALSTDRDHGVRKEVKGHPAVIQRGRIRMAATVGITVLLVGCAGGTVSVLAGLAWASGLFG